MERVRAIPEGFVRSYGGIDPIFGILGRITRRTRLVAVSA
jgi:alkylated DNA nucleotide flippase Atl1